MCTEKSVHIFKKQFGKNCSNIEGILKIREGNYHPSLINYVDGYWEEGYDKVSFDFKGNKIEVIKQ